MERRWLEEQLAAGHSLKRIGRLAGKNQSTVSYWLRKYGLRAVHWERCAPKGAVPEDALRELIAAGLPIARVAQALGVSTSRIQYWLRRYGMQTKRGERIAANRQARTGASTELQLLCGRHGAVPFRMDTAGRYRCVRCSSEAVARRRRRVKEILVRDTGGKCGLCGYDRYQGALHFHHVERSEKSFAVSHDGNTRSLAKIRAEIRKCVLLCGNCHAEVEAGVTALPFAAADRSLI